MKKVIRCLIQVPERQREGDAGGEERAEQEPGTDRRFQRPNLQRNIPSADSALLGLQLVHQRACSTVEADDRGDVRGSQEGLYQRRGSRRLRTSVAATNSTPLKHDGFKFRF
jgi:hypothetical protein